MKHLIASLTLSVLLAAASSFAAPADLETTFRNPPDAARTWVYWFWIDGNITREGITADLEAMHRTGIRGVIIMEVDVFVPKGPVRFLSPKWRELFQHATSEATRLGITIDMNNDGGWCGSGGPWITPELSMQIVVSSETRIDGPRRFSAALPQPKTTKDFYRDIAVVAFPTPLADARRMADARPKFTRDTNRLTIEFPKPFSARSVTIALDLFRATAKGTLAVSDDGREFRNLRDFAISWPASTVNFDRVSSRYFRLAFAQPVAPAPEKVPFGDVELHGDARIEDIPGKAAYVSQPSLAGGSSGTPIPRDKVVELTAQMDASGRLNWNVPPGNWTVLRIGHTTTGKVNHPAPAESLGLECDKLSKHAVDVHFAALMGKLIDDQRAVGANALAFTHIDSWETGSQNWTPGFREEFRARRGYDLLPYLPVFTGRAVESAEVSERFLWDLRRTVADMLLTNYAGHFRNLSHRNGLKLSIEAYGNGPLDDLPYAGIADLPVTEFWMGMEPWWVTKEMASAAHTYGKPVLAAEAFTSRAWNGKWQNHPFRFKPLGDQMLTLGINRFVIHRYTMQPWLDRWPGMTMGPYGIHFERTITWWEQSKAWLDYLARCQHLLQQGRFVADVAYVSSERAPNDVHEPLFNLATPPGYDYDAVSAELLSQMTVRDGRPTLPSGMSYRVLVLPTAASMRVTQLRKIKELVAAGAIILGPPPSKSPSLAEYGAGDAEVRRMAAELWADCDGVNITEHRYGRGKVVWGKPLANLLSEEGAAPDFGGVGFEVGKQLRYIHRVAGDKDIYFLASAEPEAATFFATFRVEGKRPELWWPDSGRIQRLALYDAQPALTRIPIRLPPYGSVFVVFTNDGASAPERLTTVTRNGIEVTGMLATSATDLRGKSDGITVESDAVAYRLEVARPGIYEVRTASGKQMRVDIPGVPEPVEIAGPWQLEFPKGWGAPERVALDRLISWTEHPDDSVRHFSGTATYRRSIAIPSAMLGPAHHLYLDLGRVEVIAEVRLNGRDLGILWKPPFRVDITEAARAGENDLEVRVVNLWPNRLIGDDRLPPDAEWTGPRIKSWPQWLLDGKPSPTGRFTFAPRKHWSKDDPLLDSGLLGPVRLQAAEVRTLR
jgi:hypothetical protein